jgi:hypothetical protein
LLRAVSDHPAAAARDPGLGGAARVCNTRVALLGAEVDPGRDGHQVVAGVDRLRKVRLKVRIEVLPW